jgi:hypothetical protein
MDNGRAGNAARPGLLKTWARAAKFYFIIAAFCAFM